MGCDLVEIWAQNLNRNGGDCGARLRARVVETRKNELRDAGPFVMAEV